MNVFFFSLLPSPRRGSGLIVFVLVMFVLTLLLTSLISQEVDPDSIIILDEGQKVQV